MQYNAKAPYIVETHWQIEEVLDGDSIIICHRFTQMKKEIRLYGLDAPEVKLNRKMIDDEEKSHLPALAQAPNSFIFSRVLSNSGAV